MATVNQYFQSGKSIGNAREQLLYEDLIIESMKIYGIQTYYIPRKPFNQDPILGEDPYNSFNYAYPIEMYMENVTGYAGEDEIITKFGLDIRDSATFIVSRRRWRDAIGDRGQTLLDFRPTEGDIIYMPLTQSFMEIRKVDSQSPFFQIGKLYVFRMNCELFQYSNEVFDTGIAEIDNLFGQFTQSIDKFELLDEAGNALLNESGSIMPLMSENYSTNNDPGHADNDSFTLERNNTLDFSERNPFGDVG
jgi:hypothetical protein